MLSRSYKTDIAIHSVISASLNRLRSQYVGSSKRNDASSEAVGDLHRLFSDILASLNDLAAASSRLHALFLRDTTSISKDGRRHIRACIVDLQHKQSRLERIGARMESAALEASALNQRLDANRKIIESWRYHDPVRSVMHKWGFSGMTAAALVAVVMAFLILSWRFR